MQFIHVGPIHSNLGLNSYGLFTNLSMNVIMKKCLLMFGILLIVVIMASLLERKNNKEVLDEKLAMGQNEPKTIINSNN